MDGENQTFERELAEQAYGEHVRKERAGGQQRGVTGTPTVFINRRLHDGPDDVSGLSAAIQQNTLEGVTP